MQPSLGRLPLQQAFSDALRVALLGFLLLLPLIAFKAEISFADNKLVLLQRWPLLFGLTAALFGLRFILNALPQFFRVRSQPLFAFKHPFTGLSHKLLPVLFVLALVLPFIPGLGRYEIDLGVLILTYIMLGWGLNIVVGLAGLLNLGYAAFFAIGAYTYALLATSAPLNVLFAQMVGAGFWAHWAFWICLPVAGLLAALFGVVLAFPVLRLRGDYLAIVTLAFGEITRLVLINWSSFTNGSAGITGVPRPSFFGFPFTNTPDGFAASFGLDFNTSHRLIFIYYIILALVLLTHVVVTHLRELPIGRAWEALREDEIAAQALGLNVVNIKLSAFAVGAFFAGIAGAFFATRQGFVSPESFSFQESAIVLAIVVLAGSSQIGIVLSSIAMIGGVELLRNITFLKTVFGSEFEPTQYRMLLFGIAMVLIMLWKPNGLLPNSQPTARLKESA